MTTQPTAGELLVGAYLKTVEECELVMYNQRSSRTENQLEIDVIGVNDDGATQDVFICEVTTHIGGVRYGTIDESFSKFRDKFERNVAYVTGLFESADTYRFQLWSPSVTIGLEKRLPELMNTLNSAEGMELDLVINDEYAERMEELKTAAGNTTERNGELGFRLLQILQHTT
ncbi:hypothetical protein DVK00_18905 [Haloarcula sp. Atlit-47R]|uniref:hypothetical protein n=1 Tax=Haloarcula sp. Atlit-47R TaxID=2282132 RepID=UPI000EF1F8E9|nr:hypothetical protein [Haloarcula sp. Atlit-47R]RLM41909.1 hypothetical protein DVK00_18905 [Haloarcula sp. Atlit-47R]